MLNVIWHLSVCFLFFVKLFSFIFRMLIEQAQKEKRVILTRDAKLQRHDYLMKNQIYRVKSLLKNEQLLEVWLN